LKMSGCAFFDRQTGSAMRLLGRLGQQTTLVKTNIAWRRANPGSSQRWRSMYSDMSKRIGSMPLM
jgi:hypothetical protein